MTLPFFYRYPLLISGILIRRYKRFFADIELVSGETIVAHCPNTGPMIGVSTPGSPVLVSTNNNPKRKLSYTWEAIQVNDTQPTWVGINTNLPNRIIKLALEQHLLPELAGHYTQIRPEFPYGKERKSRVDFLLTGERFQIPIYVEVKNTTLAIDGVALFPDTVTTRGQRHLLELTALLPEAKPVMLYFINRSDCSIFAPADRYDSIYGKLFREAIAAGIKVLPYRFEVTPQGINYLGLAKLLLEQPK